MLRRRALILVSVAGALVGLGGGLGGCFLTTGLDGFSGVADGGGAAEGGSGPEAAVATTPPDDGGNDANNDGAAAADATFRCTTVVPTPTFCTDFDSDGTVNTIIGAPETSMGGTVVLDDKIFRSSGRSLRANIPGFLVGATARASVERRFQTVPTASILVAFDMRVSSEAKGSTNTLHLNMGGYTLSVFIGENAAKVRQGVPGDGGAINYTSVDRLPPKVRDWVRLSLAIKFAGTPASNPSTATLAYDGVSVEGPIPIIVERYKAPNWSIDIGFNFVDPPDTERTVHIDNLVVDVK